MTHIHDRLTTLPRRGDRVSSGWEALRGSVSNLDSGLRELGPLCQLLPCVDVRVVRALEGPLQLLQLLGREGGPAATLLPLEGQARL